MHAHAALRGDRAGQVGIVLELGDREDVRHHVTHPRRGEHAAAPLAEQPDLVGELDACGIDPVGGRPVDLAVRRLGCELSRSAARERGHARRVNRLSGQSGGGVRTQVDGRCEPDGAVDDDPEADSQLGVIRRRLGSAVTQRDVLGADLLNSDARLGRAEPGCLLKRRGPNGREDVGLDRAGVRSHHA